MATSNASSDPDIHMSEDILLGEANGEQLSNDDAVSLFNSSLRKALQQQNEVIVSSIVKQLKSQPSENRANTCEEHEDSAKGGQFDFKHEGHRIQHSFNAEILERLSELKNLIAHNDLGKAEAIIDKEIAEFRQRNKILKIADRHGWDTVNEYLDDPLADNNDDAIKLRGAVNRAVRKRNYRGKPYSYTGQARRQNAFSANDFFRGFGQTFAPGVFKTIKPSDYATGQQAFYDRKCFFCRQSGHYVRDCPFARGQQVPAPNVNPAVASTSTCSSSKQ